MEFKHPTKSKDSEYFAYKFNGAGYLYEVGISIFKNAVVWISGPHKPTTGDLAVFRSGLKQKTPAGKKGIGDTGYKGEIKILSTRNSQDSDEVKEFKRRARMRHESFYGRMKIFQILFQRYRHEKAKHKYAFQAVAVICQYQMENGKPLFDV